MSLDPVRRRALEVLLKLGRGQTLDRLLDRELAALNDLGDPGDLGDRRQAGLLGELVKGSLQWRARYDHLIAHFSHRRKPNDRRVQEILRLGLHQLVACDGVPAYAAVDQSVELCRTVVGPRPAKFVNAMLQNVRRYLDAAEGAPTTAIRPLFPDPHRQPLDFLASYQSQPRWLVQRWLERYGAKAGAELCAHNNRPAPLTLHVLAPTAVDDMAAGLRDAGHEVGAARRCSRALVLEGKPSRAELSALLERFPCLIVQDEGAQEVTAWLAQEADGPLLDLCAAPGGKTFHLAAARPASGPLVAMDRNRHRLALLAAAAKRIETNRPLVVLADGKRAPFPAGSFASVLLDGPCSGTGVLRRHPEGRWRISLENLSASRERLLALAHGALDLLQPGGLLMYATCSLEPEENEEVIAALVEQRPDLAPEPQWRYWLPFETGCDGFFGARLRKRSD